jgi:hypothetical protein
VRGLVVWLGQVLDDVHQPRVRREIQVRSRPPDRRDHRCQHVGLDVTTRATLEVGGHQLCSLGLHLAVQERLQGATDLRTAQATLHGSMLTPLPNAMSITVSRRCRPRRPATSLFEDGDVPLFRGDEVLAEMLDEAGYEDGQEFLAFCGSGYMASVNYFAGRLLGLEQVRMYDGSLTDWNARGGALLPGGTGA